jgi:hypothetical protein
MHSIRFLMLGVGLSAMFLVTASPVLATAPVVIERNVFRTVDTPAFLQCGNIALDYHLDVRRTITEFYDPSGAIVRWEAHAHYKATLTEPTSGLVIRDDGSRKITDDSRRSRTTVVGGAHHVTWPGHGLVFGEVGRVVYDWNGTPDDFDDDDLVFAAGIHQDSMARDLLCELVS